MRALAVWLFALCCAPAWGNWKDEVPSARLLGEGEFCVLGFCLYDAQLWGRQLPIDYNTPFALVLTYERHISREHLTDAGVDEIRRLAVPPPPADTLARWREDMLRALTDVAPGDSLCGVFLPGIGARFYANGQLTTEIDDPGFARAFFGIWLDPQTRAQRLRSQLLGGPR
jgi:hypothetical protein